MSNAVVSCCAILAASLVVACAAPRDELDATTLERVGAYRDMALVNASPYASTIAPATLSVWFGGDSMSEYLQIRPDRTGSGVALDPGSMIVRAVLSRDGKSVEKLTVMCKGPAGYDPSLGDWWFAVTDPEGAPLDDELGDELVGRIGACHGCHVDRAADDHLFGVPLGVTPPRT